MVSNWRSMSWLKATTSEPLVELAGFVEAAVVVVAAAQDPLVLVSGVRGLARRMWASSGIRLPFGSRS